jgi:nicotinamidase/pyrazinamidase
LASLLADRGVSHLCIGGLATDYCIRSSVLDARKRGFAVTVLTNAIAGVDLQPGDSERALNEMQAAGAEQRTTDAVITELGRLK